MKHPRIPQLVSETTSVERGFRMLWQTSRAFSGMSLLLGLLTAVCLSGCGQTNSDEYETIDESHSAFSEKESPKTDATETVAQAGQGESKDPSPEQPAGTEETPAATDTGNTEAAKPEEGGDQPGITIAEASSGNPVEPAETGTTTPGEETPGEASSGGAGTEEKPVEGEPLKVVELREIKLLIPEKKFQTVGRERALRVTFDDIDLLKILNMEPVPENAPSLMPDWLKELDGKKIRLRGFMFPTYRDTGVEIFVFARDNELCCFGRSPKMYDVMKVSMKDGVTTDYIEGRPFDVIGTFHIADKAVMASYPKLYSITDAIVIAR